MKRRVQKKRAARMARMFVSGHELFKGSHLRLGAAVEHWKRMGVMPFYADTWRQRRRRAYEANREALRQSGIRPKFERILRAWAR